MGRLSQGQRRQDNHNRYQQLAAVPVQATVTKLAARIQARFGDRGLTRVAGELVDLVERVDRQTHATQARIVRAQLLARIAALVAVALAAAALVVAFKDVLATTPGHAVDWVPLVESGINNVVFVAIAVVFLWAASGEPAQDAHRGGDAPLPRLLHRTVVAGGQNGGAVCRAVLTGEQGGTPALRHTLAMPPDPLPGPATDAQVPAWVASLGLPGLADIHVHFLPERVLTKVWDYFDAHGWSQAGDWEIHYRLSEAERLAAVRALGLRGIPALTYAHKPGMATWLNQWCADFARRVPEAVPSGTFFPEPEAASYVPRLIEEGVRLFKVHVTVGGFDPGEALLDPAWSAVQDAGTPVVLHAGSGPHPGVHTGPEPVAALLRRFPRLVLVIAHLGMPEHHAFADLAEQYAGVHLDTTMAGTDYVQARSPLPSGYLPRLADLQHKVVLGADFPNIPYPYAHQLQALARFDLGDDWLRDVLWHNGARLMRLGAPAAPGTRHAADGSRTNR